MIPKDCKLGTLLSIFTKEDRSECVHRQGIKMSSILAKIFKQILQNIFIYSLYKK